MNPFAIGLQGDPVNKPERLKVRDAPAGQDVVLEGSSIIMRRIVDPKRFRAAAAAVIKHAPKPAGKGAGVLAALEEARTSRHRR